MKTFIYKIILISVFCLLSKSIQSQTAPNWSVNTSGYQHTMTFTAFLNVNGSTLTSSQDQVAAFVNDEIRGVSNVVFVDSLDKYVVFLTVFSNTNGEVINFKIYDSANQVVVPAIQTPMFNIDESVGGVQQSYNISSTILNDEAEFTSFSFKGLTAISTEILSTEINIVLPENTDLTSLTPVFTSSNNSKVFINNSIQETGEGVVNFSEIITYSVLSEDESTLREYNVNVSSFVSNAPTSVVITGPDSKFVNTLPVTLDVVFSNTISNFEISDFVVENAIVTSLTGTDFKNYKITVIPLSQGEFSLQLPEGIVVDKHNNLTEASNKVIYNYDIVRPVITNLYVDETSEAWVFVVDFSEEVSGVSVSSFELMGAGATELEIDSVEKKSETQYKVNVANTSNIQGSVSLGLKDTSGIQDAAGNLIVESSFEAFFLNNITPISITAEAKTKAYGELDPVLTYKITSGSLRTGDTLSGGLNREKGEDVGTYLITSSLSNPNYAITYNSSDLTITSKAITVTAESATKV
ncbi:MBG domain-containing protein, partial [uncultured Polaribacter sp.]|uniref:MBG domain-containing protein n=1 Tax=uncultured Polaribacter sp. TaxID=174711 RepID=UPI00261E3D7D